MTTLVHRDNLETWKARDNDPFLATSADQAWKTRWQGPQHLMLGSKLHFGVRMQYADQTAAGKDKGGKGHHETHREESCQLRGMILKGVPICFTNVVLCKHS